MHCSAAGPFKSKALRTTKAIMPHSNGDYARAYVRIKVAHHRHFGSGTRNIRGLVLYRHVIERLLDDAADETADRDRRARTRSQLFGETEILDADTGLTADQFRHVGVGCARTHLCETTHWRCQAAVFLHHGQ